MVKIRNIDDVVQYQLCTGCGVCASIEHERYQMVDIVDFGLRPRVKNSAPQESGLAFSVCPGHRLARERDENAEIEASLQDGWGPVYGVWEGYASEYALRHKGSSGGAVTALAIFGLKSGKADQVLHIGPDEQNPLLNKTVLSTSREELISRAGSRYAPASPCEGLHAVKRDSENTIFIGKPCDVAAASNWEKKCDHNLAIRIGFFCAGVPSTAGNISLLEKQFIEAQELAFLKYRGEGWPGLWSAKEVGGKRAQMAYADSWGYLQKYRQWRCYICPDHTGEFADIAVGDPWYRPVEPGEPGKSLIVARTHKGRRYLEDAVNAGYLILETHDATLLPRSQPNLLETRGALWARLVVLKLFGAATPDYVGFKTFKFWWKELSRREKLSSIGGTITRVVRKKLRRPLGLDLR